MVMNVQSVRKYIFILSVGKKWHKKMILGIVKFVKLVGIRVIGTANHVIIALKV